MKRRFEIACPPPGSQQHRIVEDLRSRPDIGDVLSFCSSQAAFRARQHVFKVCIMTNMVKLRDRYVGKY